MQNISKQQFFIGAGAIVLIVAGVAAWYFLRSGTFIPGNTANLDGATTPRYKVELVPTESPAPSLTRPFPSRSPNLDASVRAQLIANIEATIGRLKTSPDSYGDWMLLGVQRQMLGDYEGASEAWEYISERAPNDATAYGNLGNLYAVYIKDYSCAEAYYKTAIALSPSTMNYYSNLHEVYRYNLKDNVKAIEILKQGIQALPKEVSLHIMLARYYKDLGQSAEARAEYDAAISLAAGNSALIADLQAEENSF